MRQMWLLYAFSGPIMWALSTHIDKFLVDKYFRDSDTAVLMVFTALLGVIVAMLGLDAWNSTIWPGQKFPLPAPSGTPLDPDEPDQRPDPKKA